MNVAMMTRCLIMTPRSQSLNRKWSNMTPGPGPLSPQLQQTISFTDIDTKLQEASKNCSLCKKYHCAHAQYLDI